MIKIAVLDGSNQLVFSDYERHFANIQETLTSLIKKAKSGNNEAFIRLYEMNKQNKTYKDMGTTIAMLLVTGSVGYHISIGDSRIYEIKDDEIIVYADNYAKFVEITSDEDVVLSDNYFDMFDGKKIVKIVKGAGKNLKLRSAYDIK